MRSLTAPIEAILFEMGHYLPEAEVAGRLSMLLRTIHNRLKANGYSPENDGRDNVCCILEQAINDLEVIED